VNPRNFRFAALLAISFALVLPAVPASARSTPLRQAGAAGVTGGALFGGTYPLVAEQGNLGRKLSIVRIYYMIGQKFTTPHIKQLMSHGTTVLASLDVPFGHGITYASIAAGRQDKQISAWLTQVEQNAVTYHVPAAYVTFEHEANAPPNSVNGTPAQFIKAWNHMHSLATKAHLNVGSGGRLRWALILEHLAYFPASQRPKWSFRLGFASKYWPGNANVDVVAADGYNRGGCRNHRGTRPSEPAVTPGSLFNPVLAFAKAHGGKPVFLAEWASAFYSAVPAFQVNFINAMKSYVLANPRIAAALYWDDHGYFVCSFAVNGHSKSVSALAAMGRVVKGHIG
jgi:hypothetical protein